MSKGQFKSAIGLLTREGAVEVFPNEMKLIPPELRVPAQLTGQGYDGKAPYQWIAPEGSTMFVGNLAFEVGDMELAKAIEELIGVGKIACVKISKDYETNKSRGFGHVDFFDSEKALSSLSVLSEKLSLRGRSARVEMKKVASERPEAKEKRDWGASSQRGVREFTGVRASALRLPKLWTTVYAGNLPYDVSSDSLRYLLESNLGKSGEGSVAGVRIAQEEGTGKSRGFAHIDFFDNEIAERAVKELNGMSLMGRSLKLDLEKTKKPSGTGTNKKAQVTKRNKSPQGL